MSELGTNDPSVRYDSSATEGSGENERHSLQAYVSDLLALEQHISQPLGGQQKSDHVSAYPQALTVVTQIGAQNEAHIEALKRCLDDLGGHGASPIKSAWSSLLGNAATAIGASRKTKVTKWLRDDYTALNLAAMSYTLLHATATGLGDTAVAGIARQGLTDYARSIMQINQVIPEIVLGELRDDGENVVTGAADRIRRETNDVWRGQSSTVHN